MTIDVPEKLSPLLDPLLSIIHSDDPANAVLASSVATLARIVLEQERRIAVLEPCRAISTPERSASHAWLDDGSCGFCRIMK